MSAGCVIVAVAGLRPKKHAPPMARILIIDDDAPFRAATALLLKLYGHEVHEAGDAGEAVRRQLALHADVVLCDVVMPRVDGGAVMRAIRELCPDTRIIAMSGAAPYCQPRSPRRITSADRTLAKPFSHHDLSEAVDSVTSDYVANPL